MTRFCATIVCAAIAAFAVLCVQPETIAQQDGFPDQKMPIDVGKVGGNKKADGTPSSTAKFTAWTASNGQVTMDLKNTTGEDVSDVHVRASRTNDNAALKIYSISTSKSGGTPFTERDPDGNEGAEGVKDVGSAWSPIPEGNTLDDGDVIIVDIKVADAQGNTIPAGTQVTLEVWWTRGEDRDIAVSATSPNEVGDGDPRASIAAIADAEQLGLTLGPAEVTENQTSGIEVACNDLTIGECDGFQFQQGSFVITPNNSTRFTFTSGEEVHAYDDQGALVSGGSSPTVVISNLRVDSRGNFVFDIERDPTYTHAIFLVIQHLRLEGSGRYGAGQQVHAKVSGAAVAGYCMSNYWHLVTFVPAE